MGYLYIWCAKCGYHYTWSSLSNNNWSTTRTEPASSLSNMMNLLSFHFGKPLFLFPQKEPRHNIIQSEASFNCNNIIKSHLCMTHVFFNKFCVRRIIPFKKPSDLDRSLAIKQVIKFRIGVTCKLQSLGAYI